MVAHNMEKPVGYINQKVATTTERTLETWSLCAKRGDLLSDSPQRCVKNVFYLKLKFKQTLVVLNTRVITNKHLADKK